MLDRAYLIEALKNWGAWDFSWEKGWDKVTEFGPCFKSESPRRRDGNHLLRIPESGTRCQSRTYAPAFSGA